MTDRARLALGVSVVIVLIALTLYRVPTTFNISAQTQVVEITIGPTHRDLWFFHDASLQRGDAGGEAPAAMQRFTGAVQVMPGAKVTVTRTGAGPLRITCTAGGSGAPVAELQLPGGSREVVRGTLVLVDADPSTNADGEEQATVLPMNGAFTVGAQVTDAISEYPLLLLEGSVTMLAHAVAGDLRYDAGRVSLDLGDYIRFDQAGDAYGLVVIGRASDIAAVFRVLARSLLVSRFGSEGYSLYASPFTRIQHDPAIQAVWAAAVFMFAILARLPRRSTKKGNHAFL